MNQIPISEAFVEKTVKEVRKNIARRERIAFGQGILWTVIVTWFSMAITYAMGNEPNPGIMVGALIMGLWYRYGRER